MNSNLIFTGKNSYTYNNFIKNSKLEMEISLNARKTLVLLGYKSPVSEQTNNIELYNYNFNRLYDQVTKFNLDKVDKLIFISAISVYGSKWDGICKDVSPHKNDYYSLSKIKCENFLENFCCKNKIQFFTLRVPGIAGKKCVRNFLCNLNFKIKNNLEIFIKSPENKFNNVIYGEDLTKTILKITNGNVTPGIYNLGASNPISINDIVCILCNKHNKKSIKIQINGVDHERIINISEFIEVFFMPESVRKIIDYI